MMGQPSENGLRILVVEDEMVVAMMLEDILDEAGFMVTCAGHLEDATRLAREGEFDAAVLDENLHGERSYPVADALDARKIPYVFATGYGDTDLRKRYPGRPVIAKPYMDFDVLAALSGVISAARPMR